MSKIREHIVVEPSAGSIDFQRKDFDTSQVWFQHPRPQWIANILPGAISEACGGSDLTYSTFRRFPLRSPADFTIPSNEGAYLVRVFMPIGGSFDRAMWCALSWHNAHRPPVVSSERFHITGNGLKRILSDMLAKPEEIDKLRTLDRRPRYEVWVRHDWRALEIAPGCIDKPRWMDTIGDLTGAEAAAAMNAFRQPISPAEALRIKAEDRRKREAAKQAAADVMPAEAVQAEAALVQPENEQPAAAPVAQDSDSPPTVTREQLREARNRKTKMAKATRAKVAADAKDKASAAAWANKVVARMEREGSL